MILVVSAPSGVGKNTVIKRVMELDPTIDHAISHTTRQPLNGEVNGKHYHFVSREEFTRLIDEENGKFFLEYAQVFGNLYGTSMAEVRPGLGEKTVILDVDTEGSRRIRYWLGKAAHHLFLLPPSYEELVHRINFRRRGETDDEIARRLLQADREMSQAKCYDSWLVNEDAEKTAESVLELVNILRKSKKPHWKKFQNYPLLESVLKNFKAVKEEPLKL